MRGALNRVVLISPQARSLVGPREFFIRGLTDRGHDVFVLAPDYDETTRSVIHSLSAEALNYSLSRTALNPARDLRDLIRLILLMRRLKPDVLFAYALKPSIYGVLAAFLAGVPHRFAQIVGLGFAFTLNGDRRWKKMAAYGGIYILGRLSLPRANLVLFQNRDDLEAFTARGLVDRCRALVAGPLGVDLRYWTPAPPVMEPVTFLLAARLLREKGIAEFVAAAHLVAARHPRTRFVILGEPDPNPGSLTADEMMSLVSDGVVEWPGYVHDVRAWLGQASVFVLPSYYREGTPRSLQEAMAVGRPIITTDTPGCRETVVPGVNGFLVPIRDVGALVAAMEHFVADPSLIERMGRESRRIAEERFDARRNSELLIAELGL